MTAAEHNFSLPIERAQELAFPAVPYPWSDRPNVGDGQSEQHFQTLLRLDDRRHRLRGFRIEQVAALRHIGHDQMLLDQPRHTIGIGGGEPETQGEHPRHLDPSPRMIDPASFRDVMQKRRKIKLSAMRDLRHDLGGERQFLRQSSRFDRAQFAHRANEMLIDRIMVVHRKLHHADDAAEIGMNRPSTPASFMRLQRDFRRVARGEGLEKKAVRLLVLAQASVDALQGLRHQPGRVRMNRQVRSVGDPEQPDEVHRIALEGVVADDVDAIIVDLEILGVGDHAGTPAQAPDEAAERGRRFWRVAPRAPRTRSRSNRRRPWR